MSFPQVANSFFLKYHHEPARVLTTYTDVTQLDDDRVMFYRRVESAGFSADEYDWERVIINRATQELTTEVLVKNSFGSDKVLEKGTI